MNGWIKVSSVKELYKAWDFYLQSYVYTYAYSVEQARLQMIKKIMATNGKFNLGEVVKA